MSDIEADNNNNVSLQRENPEEETESIPNEAKLDDTVPELDLEALHGSLARPNPNDTLKGAKLDWLKTEISDEIVQASTVLVPKHRRSTYGRRDYLRNLYAAATPLDPKMGVPSHVVSSCDGETETSNQTKSQMIEEVFVSNHDKFQQALLRVEYYDMMSVFMVPTVRSKYGTKPNKIFNNDGKNLFLHWDSLRWEDVCLWQKTINKWALDDDRTSSRWAQSFLYKSSTLELRERVDTQYMSLSATFKGEVTYLYLQLKVMFHMTRDTITALTFLKKIEEKGLCWYPNENMAQLQKEVQAVCVRLDKVGALPEETVINIMSGLTYYSVPEFTKLFDFLLQNA